MIIGSEKLVLTLQVDVIGDDDQRAATKRRVDAAGGIGEYDCLDAHLAKYSNGECNLLGGVSLVEMDTALHGSDGDSRGAANYQIADVSDSGALGKAGNFGIRDSGRVFQFVGEAAHAGAEDESDTRA
jgi:hypothetical protein